MATQQARVRQQRQVLRRVDAVRHQLAAQLGIEPESRGDTLQAGSFDEMVNIQHAVDGLAECIEMLAALASPVDRERELS